MKQFKRVAAIHDISGFGKCSLTVARPVLSGMGIETSVIPTAVLSTHTGGFTGFTYRDLTEDMLPIAQHWKSLGLHFDALYTGYVGSFEQIAILEEIFGLLADQDTLIYVDPVMGDGGKLYQNFTPAFPGEMKRLVKRADVIVPNMTEASLMLDVPYREGPYTEEYIAGMLRDLSALGAENVVLTGVYLDEQRLGAACYQKANDRMDILLSERIPQNYHGTGDVFASAHLGAMMRGFGLKDATRIAVDFTVGCIRRSLARGTDPRYGVDFENGFEELIGAINQK